MRGAVRSLGSWLLGTLAILALAGCSISASSWSVSKSVRSSSHSSDSSSSSSPGAAERAYREDVSDYTRAFVKSGGSDFRGFRSDVARLAEEHGITDWEANAATYTAIGEGLKSAGVSGASLMAYKRNLAGGDPDKAEAIQRGYDAAR
ncbi:MAG TPA: putative lipoprotein [Candidatus Binatia bacterium]|nr:putative lipoprotein [Candidatus Binatia bacterium]